MVVPLAESSAGKWESSLCSHRWASDNLNFQISDEGNSRVNGKRGTLYFFVNFDDSLNCENYITNMNHSFSFNVIFTV